MGRRSDDVLISGYGIVDCSGFESVQQQNTYCSLNASSTSNGCRRFFPACSHPAVQGDQTHHYTTGSLCLRTSEACMQRVAQQLERFGAGYCEEGSTGHERRKGVQYYDMRAWLNGGIKTISLLLICACLVYIRSSSTCVPQEFIYAHIYNGEEIAAIVPMKELVA